MLIRFGLGGQLSGSVGGVVASRNRFGQYLRNRTVPVNPNSSEQQAVRAALSFAAIQWRTLTDEVRTGWNSYAAETPITNRLGEVVHTNGFQMFVRTASFLTRIGEAVPVVSPAVPGLSSLGTTSLTSATAGGDVLYSVIFGTVTKALVSYGPALSPGVTFFRGPYSRSGPAIFGVGTVESDISVPNRYGAPLAGQRRGFRLIGMDSSGRISDSFEEIVTII